MISHDVAFTVLMPLFISFFLSLVLLINNLQIITKDNEIIKIDKKFKITNILANKTVDIVLPIDEKILANATELKFTNNCTSCNKYEEYHLKLNSL